MSDPRWTYVDTSVLVKRYVREPGSAEAGRLTSEYDVVTSRLTQRRVTSKLAVALLSSSATSRSTRHLAYSRSFRSPA